ncbi:metal ABC transporter solute-binding protein, Zn/Mn family [Actinokineospora globicatena]|uniref:Metal ABC transporter substrate-binding protein n=1 Tax=Actinokineospora globicatena TaxID=103729 RepID=A0A9W6QR37_9PSEU|nr:zinc ABC transporter substrate-binding protein [Actinokineospora globicatena]MCP2300892.1 zinc/manganese transport system substrate-binding protein [Actinokineospora globicatena]GLW77482.1 metal ABC transporter substrate-binding protein [Actinokineospora globicatena]GLW84316.1 metal ABC transporter substrate-binding protein [Actinokineospora globicatena]GLW93097.1 metal ABC transporter substrate-binding protein [Actinokineospora globicatena]
MTHRLTPAATGSGRRPLRTAAAIAGLVALTATACGDSQGQPAADGRVTVVASTNVWASVATAIGGDDVTVTAILSDPSADPHGYEAKPSDATAFAGADVVLSNGGGYDDFFTTLVDSSGVDVRRIVAVDLADPDANDHDAEPIPGDTAHSHGEHSHAENEHVWYDMETVRKVAGKVAEELAAVAPDKAETFRANAANFDKSVQELTVKAAEIGQRKPGAKVLSTEPVAAYLLRTAGLDDVTPAEFAEAVEEESDPSAAAVADAEALVTGKQVVALVYNSQTEIPVTKRLKEQAGAAGVPVVGVTETLPPGVTGYLDWMTKQVDALAGAVAAA